MGDPGPIRRMLAAIFVLGSVGTAAELVLLEHTDGLWQKVPLGLIAVGCIALGVHALRRGAASMRVFQAAMILFVVSGGVGIGLHYRCNVEFERELHPGGTGFDLFWEAAKGATPALAPGAMIQLGLLGLAHTYGHPALARSRRAGTQGELRR